MINRHVDSHGNHPGSTQKERRRSRKPCETDSGQIHKDDCSRGDFYVIKKRIVLTTMALLFCQCVSPFSPYVKSIAYKLACEIVPE